MNLNKINLNKDTSFSIYGLGSTGLSVSKFLHKHKMKNFQCWDDDKKRRLSFDRKIKNKIKSDFSKSLDKSDFIVVSPGINVRKTKFKKKLQKNKRKIITDLDLFFLLNRTLKSIVVTGTNGKSTTCKMIEHILKKNKIKVITGGNIGAPVLNLNYKNKAFCIIEASSFQLYYSKFISPSISIILNLSKDHIDWHGSFKNYLNSKFKVFSNQRKGDIALLNNKQLVQKFKKEKYKSKLKLVNIKNYLNIKHRINNNYLKQKVNDENVSFVFKLSKILNISKNSFIKSINSFKGLPHRQEIFLKRKNFTFINDSKATSFESTKYALLSQKNIIWILGGLPKIGDKIKIKYLKDNILKAYIIGNNTSFFKKQLKGKVKYHCFKSLKNAVESIFSDIKKNKIKKKIVVLLSPASASYDQFKNFEERGEAFKKLIKLYAKKYI